jgi:hypothetical protein
MVPPEYSIDSNSDDELLKGVTKVLIVPPHVALANPACKSAHVPHIIARTMSAAAHAGEISVAPPKSVASHPREPM